LLLARTPISLQKPNGGSNDLYDERNKAAP